MHLLIKILKSMDLRNGKKKYIKIYKNIIICDGNDNTIYFNSTC